MDPISDERRQIVLTELHRGIVKAALNGAQSISSGAADISYPPNGSLTQAEIEALAQLSVGDEARAAITKVIANSISSAVFNWLCILDAVGDPESGNDEPWLGVSLGEPDEERQEEADEGAEEGDDRQEARQHPEEKGVGHARDEEADRQDQALQEAHRESSTEEARNGLPDPSGRSRETFALADRQVALHEAVDAVLFEEEVVRIQRHEHEEPPDHDQAAEQARQEAEALARGLQACTCGRLQLFLVLLEKGTRPGHPTTSWSS